jgi:hypothetical protein
LLLKPDAAGVIVSRDKAVMILPHRSGFRVMRHDFS